MPLLKKHVRFLTERVAHFMQTDVNADTGEKLLLSTWTTLLDLASKSSLHLTQVRLSFSSQ
jgi:hypothetical protein